MSVLVISDILELCVDTFTAAEKYSLCNKKTLAQPVQMKLSDDDALNNNFVPTWYTIGAAIPLF